ncbi:putative catalase-like domain protein [Vibrio phage 501E54-1]|nr:putative catalase-like domain protein [Vibrio phage 501E54-1]
MKLKEILQKLDMSELNEEYLWNIPDDMLYEFNLQGQNYLGLESNVRLKCYWIGQHYCTDSWVGIRCYVLDDIPVAISQQNGRKCDENYEWIDLESFQKTHKFVLSLLEDEEDELQPNFVDLEEDLGEGYKVSYVGQLRTKDVEYQGVMVKVTKEQERVDGEYNFHTIEIDHPVKGLIEVDIRDVVVPWKIKGE